MADLNMTGTMPSAPPLGDTAPVLPTPPETVMPLEAAPAAVDPAAAAEATPATSATPKERLYAGKYASPDDLEKGHVNLTAKFNEQAAELGAYRKMMEAKQQQEQAAPAPRVDLSAEFNRAIEELDSQIDTGQITSAQYQSQREMLVANFAAAQAEAKVMARMTAEQQKQQAQQREQQFADENPEFVELLNSGELQAFFQANKDKLALMDQYDAFYAYTAESLKGQLAQVKQTQAQLIAAAREEGRKEGMAALQAQAQGGAVAANATPPAAGQGMQTIPARQLSERESMARYIAAAESVAGK